MTYVLDAGKLAGVLHLLADAATAGHPDSRAALHRAVDEHFGLAEETPEQELARLRAETAETPEQELARLRAETAARAGGA